jgi:hypothetical protein
VIFVDDQTDCCCDGAAVEHAVEHETVAQVIEHGAIEHTVGEHSSAISAERSHESVVVHGPTMVVDAAPAQPMPVAAAGPAVLPTPTAAQEPIPTLKPAIAPQSPVAPASNEQPMPEPQAKPAAQPAEAAAAMAKPTAADDEAAEEADAAEPAAPMQAAVENLAGGPTMKLPMPEPKEPNLFDLYGDEADDEAAPSEEPPADSRPETADDDAGEPAEDSAAEATATDKPEMTNDDDASEEAATDGDSETAKPDASAEEPAADDAAEEADTAPKAEPEQAEADPAAAVLAVPDEPMRRWSDDSNTHHTQGWLVEVRTDRVRILKVNGRHTTVLTESLSAADRDYVSAVGARLAAQQQGTSPAPSTTAGL